MTRVTSLWAAVVLACIVGGYPAFAEPQIITRVHYQAWNAGVDADLVERTLVRGEIHYEYPSEVSGTPSGSKAVQHPPLKLEPAQVEAISAFVKQSGFLELKDAYGAPPDQRYYPYTITVYLEGGETKEVLYRSNPEYEDPPEAFRKVQDYLNNLTGSPE